MVKFLPHLTSALALPGENRPSKSCVEMNEKPSINFIYPDLWYPNSQSVTRFDCNKAVCLPDDVQKCLWIQEVTGEFCIGLKQKIIDTAVNEWGKRLLACVRVFHAILL